MVELVPKPLLPTKFGNGTKPGAAVKGVAVLLLMVVLLPKVLASFGGGLSGAIEDATRDSSGATRRSCKVERIVTR